MSTVLMSGVDAEILRSKRLRAYSEATAVAAIGLGCLVLCGWAFHLALLKSVLPGLVEMKANTAIAMVFSGASLWLLLPSESSTLRRRMGHFLALLVALIGAVTISEYVFGLNLQFDQLLFADPAGAVGTYSPGRMAPMTSTAFLSIGLALLLLDWKTRGGLRPAQVLSLCATLIATAAVAGYLYHATALAKLFLWTQVAVHTAIGILLLSIAVFLARPRTGIAGDLTSEGSGGVMARRFLAAVFFIPFLLGWIRLQGQTAGLYGTEFGLALNTTSNIAVFAVLVWLSARKMNQEYGQRSKAEVAIRKLNAELEARVAERTKVLAEQTTVLAEQTSVLAEQAALLDLTQDSIFVRDMNDRITLWNHGAANTYGFSPERAIGCVTHELLHTEFPSPLEEIQAALLAHDHWEGELVHTRADQTCITVAGRWALQRDADGKPRAILEINNDITERKRGEDALRLSEERLTLLIQGVKDYAIFMLDPVGHVATWNEGAERMKGYAAAEIVGQHFSNFYTPEDVALGIPPQEIRTAVERGRSEVEGWRVRKDGSLFWANVVITPLVDEAGNLRGFAKVTRDITERRQAEIVLEKSRQDQLRFKDEFLSHVSHELRSPLTAIKQFTTILLGGLAGELNPEQREFQQIVLKNIRQLQAMIDDLLVVTRLETDKLSVELGNVSASEAVTDTLNTFRETARAKGINLSCELPADLPLVFADQSRLRQILIILLDNAIKFTSAGGTVGVQARTPRQDPRFVVFEVSDTGCGMPPETVERVFERLYQVEGAAQTSRKGLGLGLFICKQLVIRQGGKIWIQSQLGVGSTFAFTLPVFSLNKVIAPLLKGDRWPTESVALVMVETCLLDDWPSEDLQEEWSHEVRSLVQRCLLPNLDVLLPKMSCSMELESAKFSCRFRLGLV